MQKKIKNITIITVLILCSNLLLSQSKSDIDHIRKIYYQTKANVESAKKGELQNLLCNEEEMNVYGASWRAVGNFYEKTQYWYTTNGTKTGLNLVIQTVESAEMKIYRELLFEKGKLIFTYEKTNEPGELRFYYKNEKLIKKIGQAGEYYSSSAEEMITAAKIYKQSYK